MVVQSVTELNNLKSRIENEVSFMIPVFVDQNKHPSANSISSFHVLIGEDYYCVPINHPDASPIDISLDTAHKVITLYKREILQTTNIPQDRVHDVAAQLYLSNKTIPHVREYYSPIINRVSQQFQFKNLHLSIPLVIWMDYGKKLLTFIRENVSEHIIDGYTFINNTVIPTLSTIEKSGICTDVDTLIEHYGDVKKYLNNNIIYSEYNPYTSTGRPSNKYGGINFAAINKTDGSRKSFISRYGDDGILVQFDYEAFHLRLVGAEMTYNLPNTSVHTYLAQQYYGKQEVTPEEYEQSKARTFSLMYGMSEDFGNVDFFHKVRRYSESLWEVYKSTGYIKTKTGKKIYVEEPSQNKVFNYSVQWLETEEALTRVADVCLLLDDKLSKPILYTYDALVLDVHRSEVELLPTIKQLLEAGGFPTRIYKGKNYDEFSIV